jgi:membrane protease YdiL (CAAX protease family)
MAKAAGILFVLIVFVPPVVFLALAIKHLAPLIRGFNAPLWVHWVAPLAFLSDRYFLKEARPHRKKFLLFASLFVLTTFALVFGLGEIRAPASTAIPSQNPPKQQYTSAPSIFNPQFR